MTTFFRWIRDLLEIYTWKETWIVIGAPTLLTGVWLLFSFLISIEHDLVRPIAIWSLIFVLILGAVTTDALKKRQG